MTCLRTRLNRFPAFLMAFALALPSLAQEQTGPTSEFTRELTEELSNLREWLQEVETEKERVERELNEVQTLLDLQRKLDRINFRLKQGGLDGDAYDKAVDEAEGLEEQIDLRTQIRELRGFEFDLKESLHFLREVRPGKRADGVRKGLQTLAKSVHELRETLEQLGRNRRLGQTDREESLERQAAELEEAIEQGRNLFELVGEFIGAIEEDEEEAGERLWEQVLEHLEAPDDRPAEKERDEWAVLPVPITEEGLAKFENIDFRTQVVPLLEKYCFECHGDESSSGDLNLEKLVVQQPLVISREKWINVIEQSRNRVMPPEDATQPGEEDRETLVLVLHNQIHGFDYSQIRDPGSESTRRLTHQEYDNTIRDLFGSEVNVAGRFPKELSGISGFDNSSNTLFLQPLLMERYLSAADEIIERLLPEVAATPQQVAARSTVFFEQPDSASQAATANEVLTRFVRRAFRRPLSNGEQQKLRDRYSELTSAGQGHEEAIKSIIRRTLVSPYFLMKHEVSRETGAAYRISDWELASRLSYFLWASMPDEELSKIAATGELRQPYVLAAQVDRMIRDPRSKSLGEIFAAQWLGSQHVGTRVRLDPIDNPWCTDTLMEAMRDETALFFHALVSDNQPITKLVDADFTFVNEELASHYKMRGVKGKQMRRVSLTDDHRGGVLGNASVLAVTSFPYRTSPVVRGKWILETLLGTPPPPPPPDVSELSDEILENERLTIREKLARHRQSPTCSACHSEIDPLGLSLEKFDWFGRYRDRYRRGRIDDRGSLPGGESFSGIGGLKQVLVERRSEDLIRQVSAKMLSYALGRQLEYYDEPALRKIIGAIADEENRFQPLIHQIVSSYPFQYKRNPTPETQGE